MFQKFLSPLLSAKNIKSDVYFVHRFSSTFAICKKRLDARFKTKISFKHYERKHQLNICRCIHVSKILLEEEKKKKAVMKFVDFESSENKDRDTFLQMINMYQARYKDRRGHVDFILTALKYIKEYNAHLDVETYKTLLDVFPKGKYIATNKYQLITMHFPKEQFCALTVLETMGNHGVTPDLEMKFIILNVFGNNSEVLKKYGRMLYWMPKFKNLSPWSLPKKISKDPLTLAKMAIERITSVDAETEIHVYQTEDVADSLDKTWIVSGQSRTQKDLLREHSPESPVIVEGGNQVWLRQHSIKYFVLKSEELPPEEDVRVDKDDAVERIKSVHEQEDGIVYGVCATGTSSKDSLLSWVRLLQKEGNPVLGRVPVLFRFRKGSREVVPFSDALVGREQGPEEK